MRKLLTAAVMAAFVACSCSWTLAQDRAGPAEVLGGWYELMLELTRHTPTYSPPVASRAFAYVAVAAYEAIASGSDDMLTLAGQLNGLTPLPQRQRGAAYDEALVLEAVLSTAMKALYANTGPTGQRALAALARKLEAGLTPGLPADVAARSLAYGEAVAGHIIAWSRTDGGAVVENMGFPYEYLVSDQPGHWVPTSSIVQQQAPLLPEWGRNRPFAMPTGSACALPAPLTFSEDPRSDFYREAREVYDIGKALTPEQVAIARFWADDAMLSVTPPGHWISIAISIIDRDAIPLERSVDILMRLSISEADAFIGCWDTKYQYDLIRPVTYIRKLLDPTWEALVATPPFPEYPSGHSTQSAAAAEVLTAILGEEFSFDDPTGGADGLTARHFASFWAAADEAAISRLYGGIHFRTAIERGQEQGRCIGAFALALKTWR